MYETLSKHSKQNEEFTLIDKAFDHNNVEKNAHVISEAPHISETVNFIQSITMHHNYVSSL